MLVLKGLLYAGVDSYLVINDEIYRVGDQVGDFQITAIDPSAISFARGGDAFVLRVRPGHPQAIPLTQWAHRQEAREPLTHGTDDAREAESSAHQP